jgi:hypothetical protein
MKTTHRSPALLRAALAAFAALASLAATAGCGSTPPPPPAPPPVHDPPRETKPQLAVRGELGSIDPGAVKEAFSKLDDQFMACQKRGLDRVEVLSGSVQFFLRIGEDGTAKYAYLEQSDLGDHDTEQCLLDVVMRARWPKPDGGEAEARYSMELPLQATRPPTDWDPDKIAHALGKHGDAIDKCKAGSTGSFRATMYVGPGGRVLAAGMARSDKDDGEKAKCLVHLLETIKGLPSPGSWPAKVSVGL